MSLINREDTIRIVEATKEGVILMFPNRVEALGLSEGEIKCALRATDAAFTSIIDLLKKMPSVEE